MPTSGEAKIHAASSYNLRSRPLPKTRQGVANKENTATSRIPARKSKLPVAARKPPAGTTTTKTKSQTRVRTVPNFEALHKNWQKKFHQGKAVTKKPCTQTREFDLTRQGARFKRAYYSGDEQTDEEEDVFQEDQDALQSILSNRGLGNDVITGRTTVATMGGSRQTTRAPDHRQTLGALPNRYNSRANNAFNMPSAAKMPRHAVAPRASSMKSKQRIRSLVDEQEDAFVADFEFENDNDALATILNDTGIQRHHQPALTRQTVGGAMQARTYQRTSIYYQKPKNENRDKVYADFARLTIGGVVSPTMARLRGLDTAQTMPRNFAAPSQPAQPIQHQRVALLNNTPGRGGNVHLNTPERSVIHRPKTPGGTASRVPARQKPQDISCSPALRRMTQQPQSSMRTANSQRKAPRAVCWAEVLNSPPDNGGMPMTTKDELATTLFAEEESQLNVPIVMAQRQQQQALHEIEAGTMANRHKVEEMEAIELQLQQEIERLLQQEATATSRLPTSVPSTTLAAPVPVASQPQYIEQRLPIRSVETEAVPTTGVSQPHFQSRVVPTSVPTGVHSSLLFAAHPAASVAASMAPVQQRQTQSGVVSMSSAVVQHSFLSPAIVSQPQQQRINAQQQRINAQQQNGTIRQAVLSHQLIDANHPDSFQSHYQPHNNNEYQRTNIVDMGTSQQRHLLQENPIMGHNSLLQHAPQNQNIAASDLGVAQAPANQRRETVVAERAPLPMSNNVSQVGALHRNFMQTKDTAYQAMFETRTVSSSQSVQIPQRPEQSMLASQPSVSSSVIPRSVGMVQTNQLSMSSMPTVHWSHLDPTKRNASDAVNTVPLLSSYSVTATPLQPKTYATTKPMVPDSVIQTPHPVKPENHFKHRVMKQYTPAVQPKTQHPALIDIPIPIQTPMAMKNGMLQGYRGCIVSPIALMPTPPTLQLGNIDVRPPSHFAAVGTPSEPKLKLDFENVEDIPSIEPSPPRISRSNGPVMVPAQMGMLAQPTTAAESQMDRVVGYQNPTLQVPEMQLKGQWNKTVAGQLFHETLLDEECALYTCRILSKFGPKPAIERNFCNPIAKVLMGGDDMHFVPIPDEFTHSSPIAGSAFNSCATWT